MYAIITSKPGQYRASTEGGATPVEAYEYLFYGKPKAIFQIIELNGDIRVRITEEAPPYITNSVPSKFLEKFDSLEDARESLQQLVGFGKLDARLRLCDAPEAKDVLT